MPNHHNNCEKELKEKENIIEKNKEYILSLEATLYKKSQEYDKLHRDYEKAMKNNEKANHELNIILNSISWRITKPFRKFTNYFRKS